MGKSDGNSALRILSAGIWGGFFASGNDVVFRLILSPSPVGAEALSKSAAYALAIGCIVGLTLAVLVVALSGLCRLLFPRFRVSLAHPGIVVAGTLAATAFCYFNQRTFSGAGFQAWEFARITQAAFTAVGVVLVICSVRLLVPLWSWCSRIPRSRAIALGTVAALVGIAAYFVDRKVLPGLYPGLHRQLSIATLIAGVFAAHLFAPRLRYLVAPLLLVAFALIARLDIGATQVRALIGTQTTWASSWQPLVERGIAALLPHKASAESFATDQVDAFLETDTDAAPIKARLNELVPNRTKMSLLLVSVDTMRHDRLRQAGYERDVCPNFSRLADEGIYFPKCYSTYPTSAYAYSSLFTGLHASATPFAKILRNHKYELEADETWPALFSKAGFKTGAETGFNRHSLMDRRMFGHLRHGFSNFTIQKQWMSRNAALVTDASLNLLSQFADDQFLLWVHYMDPHAPYEKRAPFDFGDTPKDRYDSEVAWTDSQFGRLLKQLEDSGRAEDTVVIVMSDHGEEFREHEGIRHASSLYDEQIRVPLIIRVPGVAPKRVSDVASIADILPTLTQFFDINDQRTRHGRDLWPSILAEKPKGRGFAYAELFPEFRPSASRREMIVAGGLKLIRDPRGIQQLFDLNADSEERRNLVGTKSVDLHHQLMKLAGDRINGKRNTDPPEAHQPHPLAEKINGLRSRDRVERREDVANFASSLQDPIYGIASEYQQALEGEDRELILAFIREFFDPKEPYHGLRTLQLADRLSATELNDWAAKQRSDHPLVRTELALFRASIGDVRVVDELQAILNAPGFPYKMRVGTMLLTLGDPEPVDAAVAMTMVSAPIETARAIRALGKHHPETLITTARRMLRHEVWAHEPVRIALAETLGALKNDPAGFAARTLSWIAAGSSAKASVCAKRELARLTNGKELQCWLDGGIAESEADEAIDKPDFCHGRLAEAQRKYPVAFPDLALRMARIRQYQGQINDATRTVLPKGGERHPDSARFKASIQGLRPLSSFASTPIEAAVEALEMDLKSLPAQRSFAKVTIKNNSSDPWTGDSDYWKTTFELVCLSSEGVANEWVGHWEVPLGNFDVSSGATFRFVTPVGTPRLMGSYPLAIRIRRRGPGGKDLIPPTTIPAHCTLELGVP